MSDNNHGSTLIKRIGILGGLGPESTAAYYEYITREYYRRYGDYAYPEIIIYSLDFQKFIDAGYQLPADVIEAIDCLARAGADFVIAACNSVHIVHAEVSGRIPIPWLSTIDAAAEEIEKSRMNRVGLLGTIFTMSKGFYKEGLTRHGIETVLPSPDDQQVVNGIIYEELVVKKVNDASRRKVLEVIDRLKQNGAQGVVLGCTELPFLIRQEDTDVKVFDANVIHARKALDYAVS